MVKEQMTSQGLRALFKSNFDLAAYAIEMAKYYIRAGHDITIDQLLAEVRKNPHNFDLEKQAEIEDEES